MAKQLGAVFEVRQRADELARVKFQGKSSKVKGEVIPVLMSGILVLSDNIINRRFSAK